MDNLRRIRANDREYNSQFHYANNYIKTSKYTFITFLPLNLFEQFQRLANFYFLCLLVLQLIPAISSLTPVTTALPLIGVLGLTAIKDAYDDIQRHISDSQVNNRKATLCRNGELVQEKWSNVQVGDVIRMENNHFVAADILLLSTSEPNGLCYIETSELDGETNLKCRQCLMETAIMGEDNGPLSSFDGEITCEQPNNLLNKYDGNLRWRDKVYPLDNDKLLLRGCVLRNTRWCYGIVIFAGKDTKLMQNSGKSKFKRTSIDRLLNFLIIGIVFFLMAICLFSMVACGIWEYLVGDYFQVYLPWDQLIPNRRLGGAAVIAIFVFFSYVIVLNTVVPISLYVSVEVIRFVQSFLINWDQEMYDIRTDTYAKSRTTTLNEELGQIQYIFSDKTGTLTRNIMTFNKCSIMGVVYGEMYDLSTGRVIDMGDESNRIDFSFNPNYEPEFKFFDTKLLYSVQNNDGSTFMFFRILALCHTVMSDTQSNTLEYQAQSPDEAALVSAARNFGFVFKERTQNTITIEVLGTPETYEMLCILDFSNYRKRMSVLLKYDNGIRLYCKGADNVIYERLKAGDEFIKQITQEHLNKFAGEGLRTLCLAYRDIEEEFFNEWFLRYQDALISIGDRSERLDSIIDEIECEMNLVGVTAIEDKLQEGVPQTISNLLMAGMKVWILTGDKQETAINIGFSSQLIADDLVDILVVDAVTLDGVQGQLLKFKRDIEGMQRSEGITMQRTTTTTTAHPDANNAHNKSDNHSGDHRDELLPSSGNHHSINSRNHSAINTVTFSNDIPYTQESSTTAATSFAIVINGQSLVYCLQSELEDLFVDVVMQCQSVICCRMTPLQKALVVELVKRRCNAVTLAVGDGANDVSMIKAAHIGVGISGQEGLQAVLASDYSIAQFRFLERLLLVHGRWSYYRMCSFLRYFFNKNFAFTLCHFWYAFFCGFSAQTIFDPMYISVYNLFYTSLPVLALGIFDQDVSDVNCITYPQLYRAGQLNLLFNKKEFILSALQGCYVSAVLFLVPFGTYWEGTAPNGHGISDYMLFCSVAAAILVIVNTAQIALDTKYWTIFNHIMIWGSLAFYFIMDYFYNYVIGGPYVGSLTKAMAEPNFWFASLLVVIVSILPVLAWRFYFTDVMPSLSDCIRYKQRITKTKLRQSHDVHQAQSNRPARRSLRSGYAFAHQEGFGRLITSGKIMRKLPTGDILTMPSIVGRLNFSSDSAGHENTNSRGNRHSSANNNSGGTLFKVLTLQRDEDVESPSIIRSNNNDSASIVVDRRRNRREVTYNRTPSAEAKAPLQDLDTVNL